MDENYALLLDFYGELLSKTQREALDLKYNSDLSLSEIAEEMGGISRPAANDARKKGEKRLTELEGILGNARRLRIISEKLEEARATLGAFGEIPDAAKEKLEKIFKQIEDEL